jgi:hypothetical protein
MTERIIHCQLLPVTASNERIFHCQLHSQAVMSLPVGARSAYLPSLHGMVVIST